MIVVVCLGLLLVSSIVVFFMKKRSAVSQTAELTANTSEDITVRTPATMSSSSFSLNSVHLISPQEFRALIRGQHRNGLSFYIVRQPHPEDRIDAPKVLHVLFIRAQGPEITVAPLPMPGVDVQKLPAFFSLKGWLPVTITSGLTQIAELGRGRAYEALIRHLSTEAAQQKDNLTATSVLELPSAETSPEARPPLA